MKHLLWSGGVIVLIAATVIARSLFIVPEGRQAKADTASVWLDPGLHIQSPLHQSLQWRDQRKQVLLANGTNDQPYVSVTTYDQKQLQLGFVVLWQVKNRAVYSTYFSDDKAAAAAVRAAINQALSQCCLSETLAQWLNADSVMANTQQALTLANSTLVNQGLVLSQLTISALGVPSVNRSAWIEGMRGQGQKSLNQLQRQTTTLATTLKANVDEQVAQTVGQAQKQAAVLRAHADAEATGIYASAYQKNPEFYEFYMNLKAYQQVFKARQQVVVLDSHSAFLKSMNG